MGYILPITQPTYKDYQNRMLKDVKSPYCIGKPYKIVLNTKQQKLNKNKTNQILADTINRKRKFQSNQLEISVIDAKLSGKGLYINKYV